MDDVIIVKLKLWMIILWNFIKWIFISIAMQLGYQGSVYPSWLCVFLCVHQDTTPPYPRTLKTALEIKGGSLGLRWFEAWQSSSCQSVHSCLLQRVPLVPTSSKHIPIAVISVLLPWSPRLIPFHHQPIKLYHQNVTPCFGVQSSSTLTCHAIPWTK